MRWNWCQLVVVGLVVLTACQAPPKRDYSDNVERDAVRRLAREFQLDMSKIVQEGSEANYVAIRSETALLSQRLDSRTYFVHDELYGSGREHAYFEGPEKEMIAAARTLIKRVRIPSSEISEVKVLRQTMQEAQYDRATGRVQAEPPRAGPAMVQFTRSVDGIPVFSSRVLIGLTRTKQIGFMEAHWPEIPASVLREAHRPHYKVDHGWRAPERPGAQPESVEAGIVHSPAVGFLMDIYPAIRVIYMPDIPSYGKRLMLYFDRHGREITRPRMADLPPEPALERKGRGEKGKGE